MRLRAAAALAALALAAGCGGGDEDGPQPDAAAVEETIRAAAGAVAKKEPEAACRRLTARARAAVQRRAGARCPEAVERLTARLPGPGFAALRRVVVRDVRVTGNRATAVAEPPSDLVELARATGVTQPLWARVALVREGDRWLIDEASPGSR